MRRTSPQLERLRFSNFKLRTMLNITKAISFNLPTEELLRTFQILLTKELNIGKVLLFAHNKKKWQILIRSGVDEQTANKIDIKRDLKKYTSYEITVGTDYPNLEPFDVLIPVFHNNKVISYILIGDFEGQTVGTSPSIRNIHFIQTLTNVIIVAIENKRLQEEQIEQERLKKELETAAKIQQSLIPDKEKAPKNDKIHIETLYLPHYEVGGDYFDFEQISENEVFFCIADVSGKGISAALLMSNFQANVRAILKYSESLRHLIIETNKVVISNSKGEHFVTLFIAKYNYNSKILTYINAGHNSPILYNIQKNETQLLNKGCVGIGMLDKIPSIKQGRIKIESTSKLICYTDGLSELALNGVEDFGLSLTKEKIANKTHINHTISNLQKELNISKGNPNIFDDITILGVEFKI